MDYLQHFEFVIKNKSRNAGQPAFLKYLIFWLKVKYFLYVLDYFDVLILKIIFKKLKKIILTHFSMKNILKNNSNYTFN
jgi:hypothetical protein